MFFVRKGAGITDFVSPLLKVLCLSMTHNGPRDLPLHTPPSHLMFFPPSFEVLQAWCEFSPLCLSSCGFLCFPHPSLAHPQWPCHTLFFLPSLTITSSVKLPWYSCSTSVFPVQSSSCPPLHHPVPSTYSAEHRRLCPPLGHSLPLFKFQDQDLLAMWPNLSGRQFLQNNRKCYKPMWDDSC